MNAFLRNNMVPALVLASILGLGAMTAWMVATGSAMSIVSMIEPSPPNIDSQATFTAWLSSLFTLGILPYCVAFYAFGGPTHDGGTPVAPPFAPLLTVGILAAILAVHTYFRHRRLADRGALTWAIFVFVMGAPGFVGYLLHRTWPSSEICRNCGRTSPRDRDACLHCNTEFPLPELKGIEVITPS